MELKSAEQQRKWMKPKIINNFYNINKIEQTPSKTEKIVQKLKCIEDIKKQYKNQKKGPKCRFHRQWNV